jgi:hypothetical protein
MYFMQMPLKPIKRIAAVGAATLLASAAVLATTAAPAFAATTRCSAYQFQTAPSVTNVAMKTCVVKSGNIRHAYVIIEQARTSGGATWDKFKVHARLEHNNANKETKWCDFTDDMNRYLNPRLICTTPKHYSTTAGGWTGDAVIVINFNLDGYGDKSRALTGSPAVS